MAGKTLIISEKPSVGRDLAKAVPGQTFKRSADGNYLESEKVIVSWAVGHLLRLANPEEYNPDWKTWRMSDLPLLPPGGFNLKPVQSSAKQLKTLKSLLGRDDVTQIINACDAGREGELIFRYIMQAARCRKPVKRLWLASLTDEAISDGLRNVKPSADYDRLADAARCRSEADWLVGMNASRAATLSLRAALGGSCSIGRVQTPTLAILVRREIEIRDFVAEDFWIVEAAFTTDRDAGARRYTGAYEDGKRLKTAAEAEKIAGAVRGSAGVIDKVERKTVTEKAPNLYDLTLLQREASSAFGFTAKRTLEIAQTLYEQHKVLTYPRTDSRWLTADMGAKLPDLLAALTAVPVLGPHAARIAAAGPLPLTQVVNDAKVTDHHAIIPTGKTPPASMTKDEAKLYGMVCRRLLAALSDASIVQRTRVQTTAADHVFISKGRIVTSPGWRQVYDGVSWFKTEEQILPDLDEGEQVTAAEADSVAKQTQPPKRMSDATLLGAMETAGKLVDDDEAREAMKDSGLGTPATRASIIERLISAEYVSRDKKTLVPTPKGIQLIELIDSHPLASAGLTGDWERRLSHIEAGTDTREAFMADLHAFSGQIVTELGALARNPEVLAAARVAAEQAAAATPETDKTVLAPCPNCKLPLRESKKAWSCWSREHPGCGMTIWKVIAKKKITRTVALELATKHRTAEPVTGFTSKAGKTFDAKLKLARNPDGSPKVVFDFDS